MNIRFRRLTAKNIWSAVTRGRWHKQLRMHCTPSVSYLGPDVQFGTPHLRVHATGALRAKLWLIGGLVEVRETSVSY